MMRFDDVFSGEKGILFESKISRMILKRIDNSK
jgi:hypothetical protein